jgi:hypothetical protein
MTLTSTKAGNWRLFGILVALLGLAYPVGLSSQTKGENAVWQSSSSKITSPAFIDATAYATDSRCTNSSCDICYEIYWILNDYQPVNNNGFVVDARGVNPGQTQVCSVNPWSGSQQPTSSVILLPSGTIQIQTQAAAWVLPGTTRIFGQGRGKTIIQATFSSGPIIRMGIMGGGPVFGVSVADLTLDGQSHTGVDGIDNIDAEEQSYVQRVAMINIGGTGLYLGVDSGTTPGKANHSGPYSDISITVTSIAQACVRIENAEPRGLHGIVCTAPPGTPPQNSHAGIYLGGNNVSIEDVVVSGFADGIYVGSSGSGVFTDAQSDVLLNVTGGASVGNLIHISGNTNSSAMCPSMFRVCDLTILGATSSTGTNTIKDDLLPPGTTLTDPTVGMYAVGEALSIGNNNTAYSRFSTSTSANSPTWLVGGSTLSNGSSCTDPGSLYSITTAATSGTTLWGCVGGSGGWQAIQ